MSKGRAGRLLVYLLAILFGLGLIGIGNTGIPWVSRPPEQFRSGPYTASRIISRNVHRDCSAFLGQLPAGQRFIECYVPSLDLMILPCADRSKWCRQVTEHCEGHARGWRH